MNPVRGLYKHISSGRLYFVKEIVFDANSNGVKPARMVIYSQQYESELRGFKINLQAGTTWAREYEDFNKKFRKLDQIDISKIEEHLKKNLW